MKGIKFLILFFAAQIILINTGAAQQKQFRALVVTTTKGWHHESVHAGFIALKELALKTSLMSCCLKTQMGLQIKSSRTSRS